MDQRGDEVHVSETEASGGSKEGVVRWVLIVGILLAIVFLTLIWTSGALMQDDGADSETSVDTRINAERGDSEDSKGLIAPAMEASPKATASPEASPSAAETPGDAPAGDPKYDAQ